MLRTLVDTLRSRARSVAPRPRTKSPSRAVRDADEPPILTTIQRMVDKCLAEDSEEQEPSCSDDDACCVCLSRVATVRAYPCGHKISCRLCATLMLKASAKAQEKQFRCIMCRSNVYRLRYARQDPIVILCKPEAPFSLHYAHQEEHNSCRSMVSSSRSSSLN